MLYLILTALFFAMDFHFKNRIETAPEESFPARYLDGHIELCRQHNKGLAGGRLKEKPALASVCSGLALSLVCLLGLPMLFRKGDRLNKLAISMILGGAAGNFFDRLGRGYVVDYLNFPKAKIKQIRRFVYNAADLLIFLGSMVLALKELFRKS